MKEFFTRKKANEGLRLDLKSPDGTDTEEWIMVLSRWADPVVEFYDALPAWMRDQKEAGRPIDEIIAESRRRGVAAAIGDWSFKEECNEENKIIFVTEAPQIAKLIDLQGADDKGFFSVTSPGSTSG